MEQIALTAYMFRFLCLRNLIIFILLDLLSNLPVFGAARAEISILWKYRDYRRVLQ